PDDHVAGANLAGRCCQPPEIAVALQCVDPHAFIEPGACALRGAGEAPRIGERLERAGAPIDPATEIGIRAGEALERRAIEPLDRSALGGPLVAALLHALERGLGVSSLDPAGAFGFAIDAMLLDQIEHGIGRAADSLDEAIADRFSVSGPHLGRIELEAGNYLTAIAARRAPAEGPHLAERDAGSARARGKSRRKSGEATAHDRDVHP